MQQFLKPAAGVARAWIVAAELFEELLVTVHDAMTAFDPGFRGEAFPAFTRRLETGIGRGVWAWFSWHTSNLEIPRGTGSRIIAAQHRHSPAPNMRRRQEKQPT